MNVTQAAKEFGLYSRFGGWRLGYLVAACVEKGKGEGRPPKTVATATVSKVSARDFAKLASTSADRVLRHLDAWEKAAADGLVRPAADLTPASEYVMPDDLPAWEKKNGGYYEAVGGGFNGGSDRQPTVKQAKTVLEQLPPEDAAEVAAEVLDTDEVTEAMTDDADDHIFNVTTKRAGSRKPSKKTKTNRSMDEMIITLELVGVLSRIRDLAKEDSDSPLIKACKDLMRETLEILDGIEEADDPDAVDRMISELGDFLAAQQ